MAVASALSFGLALVGTTGAGPSRVQWLLGFYSPLTRVWEFGGGALLALMPVSLARLPRWAAPAAGTLGVALLAVSMVAIEGSYRYPGVPTLLPVVGTALLLVAGTGGDHAIGRVLPAWWPAPRTPSAAGTRCRQAGRCVQPASARGTVLLLGDSQAESLFPGVSAPATQATSSGTR